MYLGNLVMHICIQGLLTSTDSDLGQLDSGYD